MSYQSAMQTRESYLKGTGRYAPVDLYQQIGGESNNDGKLEFLTEEDIAAKANTDGAIAAIELTLDTLVKKLGEAGYGYFYEGFEGSVGIKGFLAENFAKRFAEVEKSDNRPLMSNQPRRYIISGEAILDEYVVVTIGGMRPYMTHPTTGEQLSYLCDFNDEYLNGNKTTNPADMLIANSIGQGEKSYIVKYSDFLAGLQKNNCVVPEELASFEGLRKHMCARAPEANRIEFKVDFKPKHKIKERVQ